VSIEIEKLVAQLDEEFDYLCDIGKVPRTPANVLESHLIGNCAGCKRDLPWPAPRSGFWAAPVSCPQCGQVYFTEGRSTNGIAIPHLKASTNSPNTTVSETGVPPNKPNSVLATGSEVFSAFFGEECEWVERRRTARYPLSAPVVVVPLNEQGRAIAEAYDMTLLNISVGGVGMMRTGEAIGDLMLIDFAAAGYPGIQAVGQVRWRTKAYGVTKLGCEFVVTK
jgi:hypothetical protein